MIIFQPWYKWWWKYIFEKPSLYAKGYRPWWTRIWCRMRGHPKGAWWFNPNGLEPNMRCKICGDDLG